MQTYTGNADEMNRRHGMEERLKVDMQTCVHHYGRVQKGGGVKCGHMYVMEEK